MKSKQIIVILLVVVVLSVCCALLVVCSMYASRLDSTVDTATIATSFPSSTDGSSRVASTTAGPNKASEHRNLRKYRHISTENSRNIYIDLGSNNGDSINAFLTKMSTKVEDLSLDGSAAMQQQGGWHKVLSRSDGRSIQLSTWHVIAMEASNRHTPMLTSLAKNLTDNAQIASMKIYNGTAIGTANKPTTFYWDDYDKADAGATIMSDSNSATPVTEVIPMMDIVSLFRQEHITVEDFVVVKMDIEGAEYDVVKRILMSGMYRYIDKMAVEW